MSSFRHFLDTVHLVKNFFVLAADVHANLFAKLLQPFCTGLQMVLLTVFASTIIIILKNPCTMVWEISRTLIRYSLPDTCRLLQ